jgi:hypothetical protein
MSTIISDDLVYGVTTNITVADTAIALGDSGTLALIQPTTGNFARKSAKSVLITVVTYPIYYTPGGTTPVVDGSVGHPLAVGASITVNGFDNIKNMKFIRQSTNTGAIMMTPAFSG